MTEAQQIIKEVGAMSYAGIFLISFLANVVVPVPEEIVLLAIGYVAGTGKISFWITLPVVIAGALLSDVIMFELSRRGNRAVQFIHKKFFSKIVPISDSFLHNHTGKIIFFSRFMVNLRFMGPFLAGQAKVTYKEFLKFDVAALVIYATVLLWAGHYFENRIDLIFDGVGTFKNILLIVIGIVAIISIGQIMRNFFMGHYVISKGDPGKGYKKTKVWRLWRTVKERRRVMGSGDEQ